MKQLVSIKTLSLAALISAAGDNAEIRFLEFFAAQIHNPNAPRL